MGEVARASGGEERAYRPVHSRPSPAGASGFGLRLYKSGQGYYTRLGTAVGGGILTFWGAAFLLGELEAYLPANASYSLPLQYGVAVGFLVVMSVLLYWVVGINRRTVDFFIATEGEMKKVNWSTRQEIVRSTKVVIVTVLLLAFILFVADVAFMQFFSTIKVLKTPSLIEQLFGAGS